MGVCRAGWWRALLRERSHIEGESSFVFVQFETTSARPRARRGVPHDEEVARAGVWLLVECHVQVRVVPAREGEELLAHSLVNEILMVETGRVGREGGADRGTGG